MNSWRFGFVFTFFFILSYAEIFCFFRLSDSGIYSTSVDLHEMMQQKDSTGIVHPLRGLHTFSEEFAAAEKKALEVLIDTEDVNSYLDQVKDLRGLGTSWFLHPDGNGTYSVALINNDFDIPSMNFFDTEDESEAKTTFYLYNSEHPEGRFFTMKTAKELSLPKKDGVKIICHGWKANGQADIIQGIKNAYIAEYNFNIIGVDWSYGSQHILYNLCAKETAKVGKVVGELINILHTHYHVPYEEIHVIGHSLGAHISGFAGRHVEGKIGRITGLDPALPGFQYLEIAGGRLSNKDAKFVDIIHSCACALGMSIPLGHVDFYPNGGSPMQPGCGAGEQILDSVVCSHGRSYEFFRVSINKNSSFIAIQCDSWKNFKSHTCPQVLTKMGEHVNKTMRGTFYLKTEEHTPYFLGMNGTVY